MNPDLALVLGIVIAGFSIPAIVSAFSDSRAPARSVLDGLAWWRIDCVGADHKAGWLHAGTDPGCVHESDARAVGVNLTLAESFALS